MNNNIEAALAGFVTQATFFTAQYFAKNYTRLSPPLFYVERGPKYARIVREETDGNHRSVHCFVRLSDGAILKAAGWKAPFIAKGGPNCAQTVRGSVFAEDNGRSALTPYGVIDAKK